MPPFDAGSIRCEAGGLKTSAHRLYRELYAVAVSADLAGSNSGAAAGRWGRAWAKEVVPASPACTPRTRSTGLGGEASCGTPGQAGGAGRGAPGGVGRRAPGRRRRA